jgi:ubiquinone/menaquinone biosynthesis C-methylase UbiE
MARPWTLDELAHAGPEHLDPAFVAGFDRKQGADPVDDVAVLRRHGLDETSTLLDLGCGTGRLALAAAPHCRRVVAVDVSAPMLELVRRRIADEGVENVDCVRGGFLSYEPEGQAVDFVYTRNALHQLPDFWKAVALDRVAGMLRPGGVLRLRDLVFDCMPSEVDEVIGRWLDGAVDDPAQGYTRADFVEHIRSEYSTFRWLLQPMLAAAGFDIVVVDFRRSVYASYTCVK